ncbi:MAG: HD-GYP domain-containing protein [Bdellovibrionales bacterium]|nr:HD-GYP domain-containing protein [Bdellovibrionales bacterium]
MTERVGASTTNRDEIRRAAPVVLVTVVIAGAAVAAHFAFLSVVVGSNLQVACLLAALSVAADFLAFYQQQREAVGSVALIPLGATVLVLPDWRALVAIAIAQSILQVLNRRSLMKGAFNIAQIVLAFAVGTAAYRSLGGTSFSLLSDKSFLAALFQLFLPTVALIASFIFVNTLSISAVLGAVSQQSVWQIWISTNRGALILPVMHVMLAFYLAWLSVNLGFFGAAGLILPIVAVRQLTRTTIELTSVTEELLDLMVAAIEARDPYTSGHSKRVARASKTIAKAIGLKPEQVERVAVAALLHDVGKIDEQFARILAKEGRLTPEEWSTMKRHPIRSAELVGMLSSLKDIVPSVRHHHENYDGTGYPDGLKGENIPLASRIIMFADTLDAITTDRPYRKALSVEDARSEFLKFRGKQFDPMICDRVVSADVWAEIYAAVEKEKDEAAAENTNLRSRAS